MCSSSSSFSSSIPTTRVFAQFYHHKRSCPPMHVHCACDLCHGVIMPPGSECGECGAAGKIFAVHSTPKRSGDIFSRFLQQHPTSVLFLYHYAKWWAFAIWWQVTDRGKGRQARFPRENPPQTTNHKPQTSVLTPNAVFLLSLCLSLCRAAWGLLQTTRQLRSQFKRTYHKAGWFRIGARQEVNQSALQRARCPGQPED